MGIANSPNSADETAANDAIKTALQAIQRARELCERAGYGGLVTGALFNAQRDTQYALDMASGRS